MTSKFIIFQDELNEEESKKKKSPETLYSIHALQMMHMTVISIKEYNFIKDLFNKLSVPYVKRFKTILDKISHSKYPEKDKKVFFDLVDQIFPHFPITEFSIEQVIEDMFSKCNLELTQDQKDTAVGLYNFMYNDEQMYLVEGFAGTGKTSLIAEIISHLLKNNLCKTIVFSAPTNKAVNVINEKFDPLISNLSDLEKKKAIMVDFLTIHKLLKYKTDFNIDGKMIFVREKGDTFSGYNLVIIDECSMLDKKIVADILKECEEEKHNPIKIILIGDPAQLPPVNENNSDIFELIERGSLMKEVVRSGKDSIVGVCNNVRKWLFGEIAHPNLSSFAGDGLFLYKNNYIRKREKYKSYAGYIKVNKWFKSFLNNPDGIILAWTNRRVDLYNKEIRKIKFGKNLQRFELGDRLILTDFYLANEVGKSANEQKPFYTSEQIEILNISETTVQFKEMKVEFPDVLDNVKNSIHIRHIANKTLDEINKKTSRAYLVYVLTVRKSNCPEQLEYVVHILKDSGIERNTMDKELASNKINELIKYCKSFHKDQMNQVERLVIRDLWKSFNKTFIDPFARVNYGFSTTVHKSQASSYNNVYVDVDDILNNPKIKEGMRCVYTAQTRAVNNLYLLI